MITPIHKGHKHSDATRKKISAAGRGRRSLYDEILMRDLARRGKDASWAAVNKLKIRSAWAANK